MADSILKIRLIGDWPRAEASFADLPGRASRAAHAVLALEVRQVRKDVQAGIRSGAPGGKAFRPLSPLTIAISGMGRGILQRSTQMLSQIAVVREGDSYKIAVRGSRQRIASIHEEGRTFKRVLTLRQRRFLFAAMKKAGIKPGGKFGADSAGRVRDSRGKFLSKSQKAALVGMTVIPARPFFAPVFAKYMARAKSAERRMTQRFHGFLRTPFKK